MNKYLMIIVILASVIGLETGYIVSREVGTLPTPSSEKLSTVSFNPPQSGKDVYDDLSSLNCKIYPVTDPTFTTSNTMQYVPSYNAFFDLARGESVILWQDLSVDFIPHNNATAGAEGVIVFLLKENCFWISFTWQFTKSGNVTQQLARERELQGFLAPNMYSQLSGYLDNPGYTTSKTGKAIQIQSMAIVGGKLTVYVQNVGDSPLAFSDPCVYVNGTATTPCAPAGNFNSGTTAEFDTPLTVNINDIVTVKVASSDGTFSQVTQTLH